MLDFLRNSTWLISILALLISLTSAYFVIMDKIIVWRDTKLIRKLKKDKAILFPLLDVKVHDCYTLETETEGNHTRHTRTPHYARLYYLFQYIHTTDLLNREIADQIEKLKKLGPEELFETKTAGYSSTVQFTPIVNKTLAAVRVYLAQVV